MFGPSASRVCTVTALAAGSFLVTDAKIAEIALAAGVPQSVVDTFTQKEPGKDWLLHASYVASLSKQAEADVKAAGQSQMQTPTVLLNGKLYDSKAYSWNLPGNFAQAVAAAKAG